MLRTKVFSAIQGSLNNLLTSDVPNFSRSTPTWIESYLGDSLKIEPVRAYQPAIRPEDGALILEPAGVNLVTHNLNLSNNAWIKGSNVRIYSDEVESPDTTTYQGDRVDWGNGEGATQLLKRTLSLKAGKTYTLSAFLRLPPGEQASEKDVLRCGGAIFQLKQLNNYINRYRICEMQFKTPGSQIQLPTYSHTTNYVVTAVTANAATITVADAIAVNQFAGGQVQFGDSTQLYLIISNTASITGGTATLTLDTSALLINGIAGGTTARLHGAPDLDVDLEFYCESSLSLHFGGIQLEERNFRTSMIYQDEALNVRAATLLSWRRNPIARLKSFGIFIDLKEWRGDGNVIDLGNLKIAISASLVVATIGGITLKSTDTLPKQSKLYLQVSAENTNVALYINSVLVARSSLYDFVGDIHSDFTLTSEGMRVFYILFFDRTLLDGQVAIGQVATSEVAQLFDARVIVDSTTIAANPPPVVLPPLVIPASTPALAKSQIQSFNPTSGTVSVYDRTGFAMNNPVAIVRNESQVVFNTRITGMPGNGNDIQLEVAYGVVPGDYLVYGNVNQPGQASVRFAYTPVDQATIRDITPSLNRIKIDSTLSFTRSRAFVTSPTYEDIAEVGITDKDDQNGYLFVDNLQGLAIGQIISQPEDEQLIDPDCYDAYLLQRIEGVEIAEKYTNGVKVINRNNLPVQVQVAILPSVY